MLSPFVFYFVLCYMLDVLYSVVYITLYGADCSECDLWMLCDVLFWDFFSTLHSILPAVTFY